MSYVCCCLLELRWTLQTRSYDRFFFNFVIFCYLFSVVNLQCGNTSLMFAAKSGHRECVSVLLKAGASVNTLNNVLSFLSCPFSRSVSFFNFFVVSGQTSLSFHGCF